jgi:hypothetical protein
MMLLAAGAPPAGGLGCRRSCRLNYGRAGRDGLVDAVQHSLVEDHLGRCQLAHQLLHGPRPDERRGTGGVIEDEGDRELDEGAPQRAAARSTVGARSVADATPDDRL